MTAYMYICAGGLTGDCHLLLNPNNGVVNCSFGDDKAPSHEDTCSFSCNPGYELAGSNGRICMSDGTWSGYNASCTRGRHCKLTCNK